MPEVLSWEPRAVNNYFAPKFSTKMWVDELSTHLMGDILNVVRKHEQEGLFDDDKWEVLDAPAEGIGSIFCNLEDLMKSRALLLVTLQSKNSSTT